MFTGHPSRQTGFWHSRQRAASINARSSSTPNETSVKFLFRSSGFCSMEVWRGIFIRSEGFILFTVIILPSPPFGRHAVFRQNDRWKSFPYPCNCGCAAAFHQNPLRVLQIPGRPHANFIFPFTVTRHPPHMPVPSTITAFKLTSVRTL